MFASGKAAAVSSAANYIEDVFSTYLYTGNGSTQTITNSIDLSTKGGLVWLKYRSGAASTTYHHVYDSARGKSGNTSYNYLYTNTTSPQGTGAFGPTSFNTDGFSLNSYLNESTIPYVSWTFRKQPKFFDVVTYTGTGSVQNISHNLGSAPACMIVKDTTNAGSAWAIYHTSLGNTQYLQFTTSAAGTSSGYWNNTSPTSTQFTVGTNGNVNQSGATYVAYLFAHNAGGFGLTGTDNVISCGSWVGNGAALGAEVNLGYEPQWLLIKDASSGTENWIVVDNMRGMAVEAAAVDSGDALLFPNLTNVEIDRGRINPTSTGFIPKELWNTNGDTYIYIAIRRGPMKVPTSGTSVFTPTLTASASETVNTIGFTPDMQLIKQTGNAVGTNAVDRLRGVSTRYQYNDGKYLLTNSTAAEASNYSTQYWNNTGFSTPYDTSGISTIYWNFRRAPSFFDEVCATPSYPTPITHNLGAVPKLRFEKTRTLTAEWKAIYFDGTTDEYELALNSTRAAQLQSGRPALPTSTSFVAYYDTVPIVVYLFAPVTGVQYISKFTGNGSSQTINCGFTGGARFICIKAFSTTGDWKVIDTARGIVSGNDPTLAFNTTSAEVTGTDCIDPDSSGFIVNQESTNNLNVNGVEYLVWAIA